MINAFLLVSFQDRVLRAVESSSQYICEVKSDVLKNIMKKNVHVANWNYSVIREIRRHFMVENTMRYFNCSKNIEHRLESDNKLLIAFTESI